MDIELVRQELARLRTMLGEADDDLVDYLRAVTHFALLELPKCVGVSITVVDNGVPYTVTATSPDINVVDASQYAADGPCVQTATSGSTSDVGDVLDEERWRLYASTAAVKGIRSSLSLPLLFEGETAGAINFYGSTPDAFDDRAHMLAEIISGHAALAIRNADLSMRAAEFSAAAATPEQPAPGNGSATSSEQVEEAIVILMRLQQVDARVARERLHRAAALAGVEVTAFATALIEMSRD